MNTDNTKITEQEATRRSYAQMVEHQRDRVEQVARRIVEATTQSGLGDVTVSLTALTSELPLLMAVMKELDTAREMLAKVQE